MISMSSSRAAGDTGRGGAGELRREEAFGWIVYMALFGLMVAAGVVEDEAGLGACDEGPGAASLKALGLPGMLAS